MIGQTMFAALGLCALLSTAGSLLALPPRLTNEEALTLLKERPLNPVRRVIAEKAGGDEMLLQALEKAHLIRRLAGGGFEVTKEGETEIQKSNGTQTVKVANAVPLEVLTVEEPRVGVGEKVFSVVTFQLRYLPTATQGFLDEWTKRKGFPETATGQSLFIFDEKEGWHFFQGWTQK